MKMETLRYGDNFIYLLLEGGRAAVADPGVADPVLQALERHGVALELILLTHYHGDHTGGCRELKNTTGCRIAGSTGGTVPLDETVVDGDSITFAGNTISVLSVPGHLSHDVAYVVPSTGMLFSGDTLFAAGCGRIFSNDAAAMWRSLCRLRDLPGNTRLYGGHDYLLENLQFAASIEPGNVDIQKRLELARTQDLAEAPSTMEEERRTNPFLRCDNPGIKAAVGLPDAAPETVFAELRHRKDRW